jgi:hypothetical protein
MPLSEQTESSRMESKQQPEWFSATRAAAWLGIDRKTFVTLVRAGVFPRGRLRTAGLKERLWNRADMDFMSWRMAENERFTTPSAKGVNPG